MHTYIHIVIDRPVLLSYVASKTLSRYEENVTCLWKAFCLCLWRRSWASASAPPYLPNLWKKCKLKELKQEVIMPNISTN